MKKLATQFMIISILLLSLTTQAMAATYLVPGGQVIGLELSQGSVTVAAFDDALPVAKNAGLQVGDEICAIDGRQITCAEDIRTALTHSNGSVDLTVRRGDRQERLDALARRIHGILPLFESIADALRGKDPYELAIRLEEEIGCWKQP